MMAVGIDHRITLSIGGECIGFVDEFSGITVTDGIGGERVGEVKSAIVNGGNVEATMKLDDSRSAQKLIDLVKEAAR